METVLVFVCCPSAEVTGISAKFRPALREETMMAAEVAAG
jgi:hypothetical protein